MTYNPGDIIGGKYQIIDFIGGGAMGAVYKAENLNMKKQVAIKVLHSDFAEKDEYQRRFMREARSAASLEHSNICTVMDFDTTLEGDPYIVMELLSGETLKTRLERLGHLSPFASVRIMRQLIGALSCAHERGIVHRDVKPDNIFLIQREGSNDFVKLIDFGIAHIESPEGDLKTLTQVGQIYGTPQYISPEQAEGDPIDHRSDIYAAGVIFYEMLTGNTLFEGKNYIELLLKQVNEPAPHLPSAMTQSARMDAIIQTMVAKEPINRYDSALEIIPLLEELLILMSNENPAEFDLNHIGSRSLAMSLQSYKAASQEVPICKDSEPDDLINALPRSKRQWQIVLLIALAIALLLILVFSGVTWFYRSTQEKTSDEIAQNDNQENKASNKADNAENSNNEVEEEAESLQPQPFNYTSEEYKISFDEVLTKDPVVFSTLEDYYNKRYSTALASLESVKKKYWNHPNFVRLYILTQRQLKNTNETIRALAHLLSIEPQATRNPGIAKLAFNYFDSKEHFATLKEQLENEKNEYTATALAWLMIQSYYDQNETRLARIIEIYDLESIKKENVPNWLQQCVNIWKLPKEDCEERRKLFIRLTSSTTNRPEIYEFVLKPQSKHHERECKQGKQKVDCDACLRNWLEEDIKNYHKQLQKEQIESDSQNVENSDVLPSDDSSKDVDKTEE